MRPSAQTMRRLYWAAEAVTLIAALALTVRLSHHQEWHPLLLVALLLALTLIGQRLSVTLLNQEVTGAFLALVLAMALLGPVPAVLFGVFAMVMTSALRRIPASEWLNNLVNFTIFPLGGGLIVRALIGDVHAPRNQHIIQGATFALIVLGVFMVTNAMNFFVIAIDNRIVVGRSLRSQISEAFVPLLPGQIATAALAALLAVGYTNLGLPALFGAILLLLIFQYLAIALLRSEDRADQLEARSIHLASLQLGVLTTLVETLALRDRSTARHAAAVARYARELASEAGCSEVDQDLAHTAGLLHDIGKFALPDRVLRAEVLSDEGRLDGYGPVADAILYHHEHVDGSGYPAGLIGNEIPLASRILAICSTYDTLTARDSYRSPMTPQDAMSELRRVAGRQLDTELVEMFVMMVEREGPIKYSGDAGDANFEAELGFERRARQIAQPALRS